METMRTPNPIELPALATPRAPTAAERLFDALVRWWRRRETEAALMGCSDRVLADVGIGRDDIPLVARGLDPAVVPPRGAAFHRWWQDLLDRIAKVRGVEQPGQREYRELMAYSDRDLDELGIRRADIPVLTRGAGPAHAS